MNNINKISPDKAIFTQRLENLAKVPKSLWFTGKIPDSAPCVAIVGSRKPTEYGKYVTQKLASELASNGVIIVSGLALGHDALAHQGALDGGGITVAVVCDVGKISPRSNIGLARKIVENNGAVISENPPGTEVKPWMFLARNRLVSGLADVVIVVEAGMRSGTLNTAMHALEQGKELMAVPGNITSPLSVGCNKLIAQGAAPVNSVDDVLEKLGLNRKESKIVEKLASDPLQQKIIEIMRSGEHDGEKIIAKAKITTSDFNQAITLLEINGLVRALGANQWGLK